ncbi:MAG TPA: heavy-metal-associated domain-containing protein [Chitinophagaceae bacterium]|nr:heavy-metal-associated domain-containing protein [Chitinophagaceae bacterium]
MKSRYFTALIIIFSFFFAASASAQSTDPKAQTSQTQKLQTIKLKVSGITCSGDCKDIQNSVAKLNGVTACKMVGKPSAKTTFEVTFDPAVVTEKEIRSKVEDTPGCENPNDRPYKVKLG